MTAKTPAERIASLRQRHKDAGRVPVTVWVQPDYRDEVRALEAKLHRREAKLQQPQPMVTKMRQSLASPHKP